MIDSNTAYRFHEFVMPTHDPFEPGQSQWPTIVAEFIAPVLSREADTLYWFLNHGADFQLCIASADYARVEAILEKRRLDMGIVPKSFPTNGATLATALGGSRWLADERNGDPALSPKRSELLVRLLHACCNLYTHQLIQKGNHWFLEANTDENNPLGSSFESVFHLIGNLSQAEVEVQLFGATQLMKPTSGGSVRIRL
jgi:hypothetical protein